MRQQSVCFTILLFGLTILTINAKGQVPNPEVVWVENPNMKGSLIQLKWKVVIPLGYEVVKGHTYIQQNGANINIPDNQNETLIPALVGKNRIRIQVRMRLKGPPSGPEIDYQSTAKDVIYLP